MAGVARRGFEGFEADLSAAWNGGLPDPLRAFENLGRAYLAFARNEPAYYSAMFEAALPPDTDQGPLHASERALSVPRAASARLARRRPQPSRTPPLMMCLPVRVPSH